MIYFHNTHKAIAHDLDTLTGDLQSALDNIDAGIAEMDSASKFNALRFVQEYGDMRDEHHRILRAKLEKANAADAARGEGDLDVHLKRPGWGIDAYNPHNWQIIVMQGHCFVMAVEFPNFEEAKPAFDTLTLFMRLAGREGQFSYETPRPDGQTDADPVPF